MAKCWGQDRIAGIRSRILSLEFVEMVRFAMPFRRHARYSGKGGLMVGKERNSVQRSLQRGLLGGPSASGSARHPTLNPYTLNPNP